MRKVIFFIVFLSMLSCSTKELKELGALPKKENPEYEKTLAKYTKTYRLYDQFETKAIVSATIFNEDFIKSYVKERERYSKTEEFQAFLDRENFLLKNYLRFFVSFYTPNEELIDLDKTNSVWKVFLETSDGKRIYPFSIKKAEEHRDVLTHYFPYLDYWAKPYYINFKKDEIDFSKEKKLILNFISVLGKISLEFSL